MSTPERSEYRAKMLEPDTVRVTNGAGVSITFSINLSIRIKKYDEILMREAGRYMTGRVRKAACVGHIPLTVQDNICWEDRRRKSQNNFSDAKLTEATVYSIYKIAWPEYKRMEECARRELAEHFRKRMRDAFEAHEATH